MTIDPTQLAVGSVCYGIGALAKTWKPFPNHLIPTLAAGVGTVVSMALSGWTVANALSGFMAGLSATGLHSGIQHLRGGDRKQTGNTEVIKKPEA